ncbi:hypothetical protein OY671_011776, partial [Metschnikowia pulcherrima]
ASSSHSIRGSSVPSDPPQPAQHAADTERRLPARAATFMTGDRCRKAADHREPARASCAPLASPAAHPSATSAAGYGGTFAATLN